MKTCNRMLPKDRLAMMTIQMMVIVMVYIPTTSAWLSRTSFQATTSAAPFSSLLFSVSSTATSNDVTSIRQECKAKMLAYSEQTQSGQSAKTAPSSLLDEIEACLQTLEQTTPVSEPARSPLVFGKWFVRYTDAPPPSNGQLGIFSGQAYQMVEGTCYTNLLQVPPNRWLTAALQATWEEWDGNLLDKQVSVTKETQKRALSTTSKWTTTSSTTTTTSPYVSLGTDVGATCWKVTFEKLDICLLGLKVIQQVFPPTTQRIWRTTYVDDDTRIVRAGTTGLPEDEYVFYMTRESST